MDWPEAFCELTIQPVLLALHSLLSLHLKEYKVVTYMPESCWLLLPSLWPDPI